MVAERRGLYNSQMNGVERFEGMHRREPRRSLYASSQNRARSSTPGVPRRERHDWATYGESVRRRLIWPLPPPPTQWRGGGSKVESQPGWSRVTSRACRRSRVCTRRRMVWKDTRYHLLRTVPYCMVPVPKPLGQRHLNGPRGRAKAVASSPDNPGPAPIEYHT